MHRPSRHIEDTVASVLALLVFGGVGVLGFVVLMLTLALGF